MRLLAQRPEPYDGGGALRPPFSPDPHSAAAPDPPTGRAPPSLPPPPDAAFGSAVQRARLEVPGQRLPARSHLRDSWRIFLFRRPRPPGPQGWWVRTSSMWGALSTRVAAAGVMKPSGLDVVPGVLGGQVPDSLVVGDAVAELVQSADRVLPRRQGAVGGVGEGSRQVGPQLRLVLAGQQEAPQAETQLRNDLPARTGRAAPPGTLLGLGDIRAGLVPDGNSTAAVPVLGPAPALLSGDGLGVQGIAQHDLQVSERCEECRSEVAVPPVERELLRRGPVPGDVGRPL